MYSASLYRLFGDETGAAAVEYGLIVALVAVVLIAALDSIGSSLSAVVAGASGNLKSG
jgi:pilus assembly protein Flp/PilA